MSVPSFKEYTKRSSSMTVTYCCQSDKKRLFYFTIISSSSFMRQTMCVKHLPCLVRSAKKYLLFDCFMTARRKAVSASDQSLTVVSSKPALEKNMASKFIFCRVSIATLPTYAMDCAKTSPPVQIARTFDSPRRIAVSIPLV